MGYLSLIPLCRSCFCSLSLCTFWSPIRWTLWPCRGKAKESWWSHHHVHIGVTSRNGKSCAKSHPNGRSWLTTALSATLSCSVQLEYASTRHLSKARLLHREPPVPSCQKVLLLDGVFSGEAYGSTRQAYTINQKIRPLTDGGFQGGAAWAAITVALTV